MAKNSYDLKKTTIIRQENFYDLHTITTRY